MGMAPDMARAAVSKPRWGKERRSAMVLAPALALAIAPASLEPQGPGPGGLRTNGAGAAEGEALASPVGRAPAIAAMMALGEEAMRTTSCAKPRQGRSEPPSRRIAEGVKAQREASRRGEARTEAQDPAGAASRKGRQSAERSGPERTDDRPEGEVCGRPGWDGRRTRR
jgi:hypothetical protein